eukprot:scaffold8634_cov115-Isochrysis_galbana.AAC.4
MSVGGQLKRRDCAMMTEWCSSMKRAHSIKVAHPPGGCPHIALPRKPTPTSKRATAVSRAGNGRGVSAPKWTEIKLHVP